MTSPRPYSPQTLADRWGCSAEKVRQMCKRGEHQEGVSGSLRAFGHPCYALHPEAYGGRVGCGSGGANVRDRPIYGS